MGCSWFIIWTELCCSLHGCRVNRVSQAKENQQNNIECWCLCAWARTFHSSKRWPLCCSPCWCSRLGLCHMKPSLFLENTFLVIGCRKDTSGSDEIKAIIHQMVIYIYLFLYIYIWYPVNRARKRQKNGLWGEGGLAPMALCLVDVEGRQFPICFIAGAWQTLRLTWWFRMASASLGNAPSENS